MDKQEKMFSLADQWLKSGLTRKVFAQQHGVTASSLEYWCRKRNDKINQRTITSGDFIEVFPNQESESDEPKKNKEVKVELELPGGVKIKIY